MSKVKKSLYILFAITILVFSVLLFASAETTNSIGDINGDGKISVADARLALRTAVGLENLTDEQFKSADVNNDNAVTSSDARAILRVSVGLEKFEDSVQTEMSKVNKEIQEFLNDDMYKNLKTVEERKDAIEDLLFNMADDRLIYEKSIKYYEDTGMYYFEYSSGISSGIYVKPIFNNNLGGTINNNIYTEASSNVSITQKNIDILSVQHTWYDSIMLYGWDNITKAVSNYSKWQETVDNCNNRNMNMTLYYAPRVQDYKSILLKKDFICIAEHGAKYPKDENNFIYCFAVYGENITDDKNDGVYAQDIAENRIIPVYDGTIQESALSEQKGFYLITPDFFRHFYGDKSLNGSIVYLSSCMGFGESSNVDNYFAEIFVEECGAKAVIGFCNSVWLDYANEFLDVFTSHISSGVSIRKALNDTISFCGASDKEYVELFGDVDSYSIDKLGMLPAVPVLFEQKNKVTGTVTDSKTGNPIPNVIIEVIDSEIDSFDPVVTTTTDSNGKYSLELPYGSYSISYTHKNYETVGVSLFVDFEAYEKNISLMSLVGAVTGKVLDADNNYQMYNVLVEAIMDKDYNINSYESFKTHSIISSTKTDIFGNFGMYLPYGNYILAVSYDNYEVNFIRVTIDNSHIKLTDNIILNRIIKYKDISGKVSDENNLAIDSVVVEVYDEKNLLLNSVTSDKMGKFSIKLSRGNYNLIISKEGYITKTVQVVVEDSDYSIVPDINVTLKKQPTENPGTKENPYQISTVEELLNIKNKPYAYYKLVNDIDLSSINWEPLGNFYGSFDGNGYVLKNLKCNISKLNSSKKAYIALFSKNSGIIKNVILENIAISVTCVGGASSFYCFYIGGIVGENSSNGTIENCIIKTGKISSSLNYTYHEMCNSVFCGGIAGYNYGTILNCINSADISIYATYDARVGGITSNGSVSNSLNTGNIVCQVRGEGYRQSISNTIIVKASGITCSGTVSNCTNAAKTIQAIAYHNFSFPEEILKVYSYFIGGTQKTGNNYSRDDGICTSSGNNTSMSYDDERTSETDVTMTGIESIKRIWNHYQF